MAIAGEFFEQCFTVGVVDCEFAAGGDCGFDGAVLECSGGFLDLDIWGQRWWVQQSPVFGWHGAGFCGADAEGVGAPGVDPEGFCIVGVYQTILFFGEHVGGSALCQVEGSGV